FRGLAPHDVHLGPGDALDLPTSELSKLDGAQTLPFRTRATGAEPVVLRAPLERRTSDDTGIRFFASTADSGTHVDVFNDASVWLYDNVGSRRPLSDGTWALLHCPSPD